MTSNPVTVVALDVGTSVVKAVRYDDHVETAVARRSIPLLRREPDWAEQDMDAVWSAAADVLREVTTGVSDVAFIAVTGQGDGCWPVDGGLQPLGPAMLWCDGRAGDLVRSWIESGLDTAVRQRNGALIFPGSPAALLRWLRDHDPATTAATRHVLSCVSWVTACLTGEVRAELSDASNPCLDPSTETYSAEIGALLGISDLMGLFPPVVRSASTPAGLSAEAASRTGLPAGTPVVQAPYDVPASVIGTGAVRPGDATVILGTTLVTAVTVSDHTAGNRDTGATIALGVGAEYVHMFPSLAGTQVLDWASRLLAVPDAAALVALAAQAPPGSHGVVGLPFFSPACERVPRVEPDRSGALLNLSFAHDRADVARALVEALTMLVRDCLQAAATRPTRLRVCGGAAVSDFWCQLLADATGIPVSRVADAEVGARGAMMVGAVATGAVVDLATAADDLVQAGRSFTPDTGLAATYDGLYVTYQAECRRQAGV